MCKNYICWCITAKYSIGSFINELELNLKVTDTYLGFLFFHIIGINCLRCFFENLHYDASQVLGWVSFISDLHIHFRVIGSHLKCLFSMVIITCPGGMVITILNQAVWLTDISWFTGWKQIVSHTSFKIYMMLMHNKERHSSVTLTYISMSQTTHLLNSIFWW